MVSHDLGRRRRPVRADRGAAARPRVEEAPTARILTAAETPYARELVAAVPRSPADPSPPRLEFRLRLPSLPELRRSCATATLLRNCA